MKDYSINELKTMTKKELCNVWAQCDYELTFHDLPVDVLAKAEEYQRKTNMRKHKAVLVSQLVRALQIQNHLINEDGKKIDCYCDEGSLFYY